MEGLRHEVTRGGRQRGPGGFPKSPMGNFQREGAGQVSRGGLPPTREPKAGAVATGRGCFKKYYVGNIRSPTSPHLAAAHLANHCFNRCSSLGTQSSPEVVPRCLVYSPPISWPALAHQPTPSYLSCLAPSPPYFLHKSRWHLASSSHLWPERLQSSLTNLSSCCPRHFPSMQGPPAPLTPSRLSPACLLQALGLPLCLGRQHPAISLCFTSHFHR